jgi:hypothetical protein
MKKLLNLFLPAILILSNILFINQKKAEAQNTDLVWSDVSESSFRVEGERRIIPLKYRTLKTDIAELKKVLRNAPFELSDAAKNMPFIIDLPAPNGQTAKFYLTEYSMMEQGLADKYPEMRTFNVKGINDPYATGKLDITLHGFHAMVLTPLGDYYIDPYSSDEKNIYISYYKSDLLQREDSRFECHVNEELNNSDFINSSNNILTGQQLRTYRLACAATGEYTAFHGGTVALGQSAIVTAINRVNGVYEREVSVRMVLVANNTNIVFTNSATDPYTNSSGSTMLGQNQTTCDNAAYIGSANYDFGHVFSTGGGGVAGLRVICVAGSKARGVTGLSSPIGDGFYIDYVAHEMGHQFGGNHTFNSVTSSCGGGNRNATTAWEPGSGSTIMPYAGICGADNLQAHSDDYFHSGSITEIATYTQTGNGNSCPVTTNTGNTPPTVTVPAGGFTIPVNTPFALTGSGNDAETPGSLTYCWEEFDVGPSGTPNSPSGNAPIFRSFPPVTSPERTFPKLSNLLNNTQTLGEILPSYSRSLRFRLTVRDNSVGGGGIIYDTLSFNVNSGAGPFLVTSPNTGISWNSNVSQTVTWNVANTSASPVNCANVNIKLSTDGGNTFPLILISNTPNDGSQSVTLPLINTSTARIKVEASGNIFFDISNTNFSIVTTAVPATLTLTPQGFYNSFTNQLNMKDTVKVYLRNSFSPYAKIDSSKTVIDSVNFSGSLIFNNAASGNYYITVNHRNSLETWSKPGGETYTLGAALTYNFTSALTQAYGSNIIQVSTAPLLFAFFGGDINQDGAIDGTDVSFVDNDAFISAEGYITTDLTGDNFVDALDVSIVDNNAFNLESVVTP